MKTVITSEGENLNAPFDKRFGRAAWFCIYDEGSRESSFIKNENASVTGGAGTRSAEKMIELGVTKIISGDFGPKAKELLEKFNIQMVILQDDNLKVQNIIEKLNK
ncbi:MAG: hypothetical protein JW894_00790 [Bacteroidales bacterium]|nr:hypothetical protein [Bacteroidales bacterium]